MATLTIADLDNGKRDLQTVDAVANSRAATATTRHGQQTTTLYEAIRRIVAEGDAQLAEQKESAEAIIRNLGFMVPVPYAPGIEVTESNFTVIGPDGNIYAAQAGQVPFTTGTWNPEQWYSVQNTLDDKKIVIFSTKAEAESSASTLPDGQTVLIAHDESLSGSLTEYTVNGGSLEFTRKPLPTSQDFGVYGASADSTNALNAAAASDSKVYFPADVVNSQAYVITGAMVPEMDLGFSIYKSGTSTSDNAHEQNLAGFLGHDSYFKFDASRFWKAGPTVLAYGDSNTAWVNESGRIGVGQGSWPAYLDAYLGQFVYFAEGRVRGDGSPGQTSQYGLDNLDTFLTTLQPQITILGWGTNDIAQGVSRAQYLENMATLIGRLQVSGQFVVVLGIPWHHTNGEKTLAWNSSLEALCRAKRVPFIPVYSLFGNAPASYFYSDGVHYTDLANQIISKLVGDVIVNGYGLPKNRMAFNPVRPSSLGAGAFECEGVYHTGGAQMTVVQTPDEYVRRNFPYALKISAGQEVTFTGYGPYSAYFSWPDSSSATWTINGGAYSPITRGAVVRVNNVSSRLNGSSANFRIGSTSGDIYLLGTVNEFAPPKSRIFNTTEIRSGIYTPGVPITVVSGTRVIHTVMRPVASAVDRGYLPGSSLQNVGTTTDRTAITTAPVGHVFLESDTEMWFYWTGSGWAAL